VTEPDAAAEIPEFALPDWGTEGAPPPPALEAEDGPPEASIPAREITLEVETTPVLSTAGLPAGWTVTETVDLVWAVGSAKEDETATATATELAIDRALDNLRVEAARRTADAIVEVRLEPIGRKRTVTVIAYGTAVRTSRP
jgi:uncharacterized protein YbjQ (UPF0145 family)